MYRRLASKTTQLSFALSLLLGSAFTIAGHHEAGEMPAEAELAQTETAVAEPMASTSQYTCSLQGLVRRVEISYADADAKVPCDVNYYKDSEAPNDVSTLWSAQNLEGYCEQKAEEFVAKLQSWGWACTTE